ncbi:MAG: pyridoxine 5'-phosphate synthase [Elusimicrobia bacterium]|nr:pyridoxine 5'-phosphate synthase [Candidatus Liberimonas magnetica]
MPKLGVNIDHIATLRQARKEKEPDPVEAAVICELAGADGITVHLREDRRHIQDRDVQLLRQTIKSKLNLEMSIANEIVDIALQVKPDDVCLVPEKRLELTTEGGIDVVSQKEVFESVITKLKNAGIRVSLFVDPDEAQVSAAKVVGADAVELHTGRYAQVFNYRPRDNRLVIEEIERLKKAAKIARSFGLTLNAGHGLDYKNVGPVASILEMNELNIGFSIIARAVLVGLDRAVREMKELVR